MFAQACDFAERPTRPVLAVASSSPSVPAALSDVEIADLIAVPKPVPNDWRQLVTPRTMGATQLRARLEIPTDVGLRFSIYGRRNPIDPDEFSVGLTYLTLDYEYRLIRCNG